MKKTGALLIIMAAILVAVPTYNMAFAAQQDGRGMNPSGYGSGEGNFWRHPAIAPEKQAAYEKIITEHRSKMQPMQNDMWSKQTELNYLSRNDDADAKTTTRTIGEMKDLRGKMQTLNEQTAARLAKDIGVSSDHAHSLLRGNHYGAGNGCAPYSDSDWDGHRGGWHRGGWHRGR